MNFQQMGSSSKALESSWVKRLRPSEFEGTCAGSNNPRIEPDFYRNCSSSGALLLKGPTISREENKAEAVAVTDIEEKSSRYAIHPYMLPKVENMLSEPPTLQSPCAYVDSTDLVTETHVIASFGPFQVRTRSLIQLKPSMPDMDSHREAALGSVDAQYSRNRGKEVATEHTPIRACIGTSRTEIKTKSNCKERQEYKGGLLGSEIAPVASCYLFDDKEAMHGYRNKHPLDFDCDQFRSNKQKLGQFQRQQPETDMWNNLGFCKEIVPSSLDHVITGNHKLDRIGCERPRTAMSSFANAFHRSSLNAMTGSSGVRQWATPSALPSHFAVLKEMAVPEDCNNHFFVDQEALLKPGSELFPSVKANPSEPGSSRREHGHGPTSTLGPHRCGIEQDSGRLHSIESYPFYSPNYPGLGNQKDEIIMPDNFSTASLPSKYADSLNRSKDRMKSSKLHVQPGTGTTFRGSDTAYFRSTGEGCYLEPESNSSHHSNCPALDQEDNSTRAENRETRLSKQSNKTRDGLSDVKGKDSNLEKTSREQMHDREFIGGDRGYPFQIKSSGNVIHRTFQENYTSGLSRRSDLQAAFPYLGAGLQPVAFRLSSREEEIDSRRNEKGNIMKGEKIPSMFQCVLSGKGSPGKTVFDSREFHQFKSRKQSSEEGPSFRRLHILSNDRESELDCNKHARLKISAVGGQTSSSGKRTHCTHEELAPNDAAIVNSIEIISEENEDKDCRPQMWLQRWIHSAGTMDVESEQVVGENLNCNPGKIHGSVTRTCTKEQSGDNRKTDLVQWTKNRKENNSYCSDSRPQSLGEGHFNSDIKDNQFMKKLLTSSASAMAIMGTRAKERNPAQAHRKDIYPVWASTLCADADAKLMELEKEIRTPDELELKPKKAAFEHEIVEHRDIRV